MSDKAPDAFRTISEVADLIGVPAHTIRHWETVFPAPRPMRRAGGRRFYRPRDINIVAGLHQLMNVEGYSVAGVRKIITDHGIGHIATLGANRLVPSPSTAGSPTVTVPVEDLAQLLADLKALKAKLPPTDPDN